MNFPAAFLPIGQQKITLPSGRSINILTANAKFVKWTGRAIGSSYGNKPRLRFRNKALFAEFVILKNLIGAGWKGVWVDRSIYRTSWGPKGKVNLSLPKRELLEAIYQKAGARNGCWDVFCWKGKQHLFIESKREKHDRMKTNQLRWLEAALACKLARTSFLIVNWSME